MKCPYCAEDIKDDAIVCRYCQHDVAPSRPLMAENARLVARIVELEGELKGLKSSIPVAVADAESPIPRSQPKLSAPSALEYIFQFFFFCVMALLLSHYLVVMKFDLSPLYMRILSIVIPLPFGYFLFRRTAPRYMPVFAMAASVGIAAVALMLVAVGIIDNVPIVPADMREWRETVEYIVSISLAFVLGAIIASRFDGRVTLKGGLLAESAKWIARQLGIDESQKGLGSKVQQIEKFLNSGIAAATAAGSVFAGVRAVLF